MVESSCAVRRFRRETLSFEDVFVDFSCKFRLETHKKPEKVEESQLTSYELGEIMPNKTNLSRSSTPNITT